MTINKHIVDNLDYYLGLSCPEYAFLITGEWGVGKTYFIDKYLKKKESEKLKLIKISLFGLKSISDINSCIFQSLHPILGSKYAKLAGNVIKGAFSMGVKLDLDSDNKPDANLNAKLDKFNLTELFSDKKGNEIAIVFDDLERCKMPSTEVLGYINALIEVSQVKVILVANEQRILSTEDAKNYSDFKEKVINKTFKVKHDFESVLEHFVKDTSLIKYKHIIKNVYESSGHNNLRSIKQSIDNFECFIGVIESKYKQNNKFLIDLIRIFFALSIEIKKGGLGEEELKKGIPFKKSSDDKSSDNIYSKYFENTPHLYRGAIWAKILFDSDFSEINEETAKLALFLDKTEKEQPDWVRLWNFRELEDDEFSILINKIEDELKTIKEQDLRVYLHKIALIIYFQKYELSQITIEELEPLVNSYIDIYKHSSHWKEHLLSSNNMYSGIGYSYICEDDLDFIKLKSLIIDENKKTYETGKLEEKGNNVNEIVNSLKKGLSDDFINILFGKYEYEPILHKLSPKALVDALKQASNKTIITFYRVALERYSENSLLNGQARYLYLKKELGFWEGVSTEIANLEVDGLAFKKHIIGHFGKSACSQIIELLSE